jgi:hypothetical protein
MHGLGSFLEGKRNLGEGLHTCMTRRTLLHAAKNGKHFTQPAGLFAIRPVAEAPKDERFYFAWLLRYEALLRFGYDPDAALFEKAGERGFRGRGRSGIPGVNLLDLRALGNAYGYCMLFFSEDI